ncbi:MAG: peptidyl-tRNA hydrolase Pth2 [Conexivisphaerales archaeon]
MNFKMSILIRTDLKMGRGKMVAQGAHAAVGAAMESLKRKQEWFEQWEIEGAAKIALKVESIEELMQLIQKARSLGITCFTVADMGLTQVEPGTITAGAIGPAPENLVDQVTGKLKLL